MVEGSAEHQALASFTLLKRDDFSRLSYLVHVIIFMSIDLCTIAAIKGDKIYEQLSVGFKVVFDDNLENSIFITEEGNEYNYLGFKDVFDDINKEFIKFYLYHRRRQ